MGQTTHYNLHYPELEDQANVPEDMRELAEDIDSTIHKMLNVNGYINTTLINTRQFKTDITYPLVTNNIYNVKFAAATSTSTAQLSLDDGLTYYNIAGCTAKAVSEEYLTLIFNGTSFEIMTELGTATIEYIED